MEALKLVELQEREGQAVGIIGSILLMVVGGAMLLVGVFATSKIGSTIPTTDLSAAENTTYNEIRQNIFDALSIGGVVIIIVGVVALIATLRTLGG